MSSVFVNCFTILAADRRLAAGSGAEAIIGRPEPETVLQHE
jgi:hypothetical protein